MEMQENVYIASVLMRLMYSNRWKFHQLKFFVINHQIVGRE